MAKAATVVRGLAGASIAEPAVPGSGPGPLSIALAGGLLAADVNRALVTAGVRVSALVPVGDTLEDVFLHLVEGADVPR